MLSAKNTQVVHVSFWIIEIDIMFFQIYVIEIMFVHGILMCYSEATRAHTHRGTKRREILMPDVSVTLIQSDFIWRER
jgi:hypothetical protein